MVHRPSYFDCCFCEGCEVMPAWECPDCERLWAADQVHDSGWASFCPKCSAKVIYRKDVEPHPRFACSTAKVWKRWRDSCQHREFEHRFGLIYHRRVHCRHPYRIHPDGLNYPCSWQSCPRAEFAVSVLRSWYERDIRLRILKPKMLGAIRKANGLHQP